MHAAPPTAVLLFSRTATAESAAKRLGPGAAGRKVAAALLRRTERAIAASGLPVVRSSEKNQHGTTFGERLAAAVTAAFAGGAEQLLVVGNDCPSLTAAMLRSAARRLDREGNLVGADRRGGAYLIGIRRRDFCAAAFTSLPWTSDRLAVALRDHLGAISLDPILKDYNSVAELRWDQRVVSALLPGLRGLLLRPRPPCSTSGLRFCVGSAVRTSGRAP